MASPDIRAANRIADESPISDWPDLQPESTSGTQVMVSGDYHNSDLTLFTYKSYGEAKLLDLARKVAASVDLPKCDYITTRGRRLISVDLEFNKYKRFEGNRSTFGFAIGKAIQALERSDISKPIGLYVRAQAGRQFLLDGRLIDHPQVFSGISIKPEEAFELRTERTWLGLFGALIFGALVFGALGMAGWSILASARKSPQVTAKVEAQSLVAAQTSYEQNRKASVRWIVLMPLLLIFATQRPIFMQATDWLPNLGPSILPLVLLGPIALFVGTLVSVRRRRRERTSNKSAALNRRVQPFLFVAPIAMLTMTGIFVFVRSPLSLRVPILVLRSFALGVPAIGILAFAATFILSNRKSRVRLGAGDLDYDFAMELAKAAGVRLRGVYETESSTVNGSASLFRTISLTAGARRLAVDERRVLIAHEIGHLKNSHVPAIVLALIAFNTVFISGLLLSNRWVQANHPSWSPFLIQSPVAINLLLTLGFQLVSSPLRKRTEHSADLYALKTIGDYGLVARSLARIHLLNGSPHTYLGWDKVAGTHPSLSLRIQSLERAASELGMSCDPALFDEILSENGASEMHEPEQAAK